MNNPILIFSLIFGLGQAFAQELKFESEAEYFKKTYGKDKKTLIKETLTLNSEEESAFWPIFEEYEKSREEFSKSRWKLLRQYNEQYKEIDDAIADRWMDTIFYFRNNHLDLLEDYITKTQEILESKKAFLLYELESSFRAGTRRYLFSEAMFLGEGDVKKKSNQKKTFD